MICDMKAVEHCVKQLIVSHNLVQLVLHPLHKVSECEGVHAIGLKLRKSSVGVIWNKTERFCCVLQRRIISFSHDRFEFDGGLMSVV